MLLIILDTNAWISDRLLQTRGGAALVHALAKIGGKIVLYEVVELEIEKIAVRLGRERAQRISDDLRFVKQMSGYSIAYAEPQEAEFLTKIRAHLSALASVIQKAPLTLDHARNAQARIVSELPPNAKNKEQFRDSTIWEVAKELAKENEVHLVSKDLGFYEGGKPENGMAVALTREAKELSGSLSLHDSVADCVKAISPSIPPSDTKSIAVAISQHLFEGTKNAASEKHFAVGEMVDHKIEEFPTNVPNAAAVKFSLTYSLADIDEPPARSNANLKVSGECIFDPQRNVVSDIRLDSQNFSWVDSAGAQVGTRNVYAYATLNFQIGDSTR